MEKILVVEDDTFFREIFSDLLTEEGYKVDTASSGNEALKKIAANGYDLVVTDMILQDISGLDILSRVKQIDTAIEVIVVSGYANIESAIYALKNGARDYLVKPISHDEFKHVIKLCMEQRRLLDENQVLKDQIKLFQISQTIANCLDIERLHVLIMDAISKEAKLGRGLGYFKDSSNTLALLEARGLGSEEAEKLDKLIRSRFDFEDDGLSGVVMLDSRQLGDDRGDVTDAMVMPLRSKSGLQGVIVFFNDSGTSFPSVINQGNIHFLLEQALLAIENAERYSIAKDLLNIDELTGLYNYRYLEIALDREMKRAERFGLNMAVIFLDIDMLKSINDTYGHLVGSRVLKEVGGVLKKSVREVDILIRYGGDEYTIILVETGRQGAAIVAERIRHTIAEHCFDLDENLSVKLTASLGFACYPEDTKSKIDLLEMADRAMYHGKVSGRNMVSHISASITDTCAG